MKKYLSLIILNYFRYLAKLQLRKNPDATIIGITGSAGKTSTRLAIVQILKTRGVVKHSVHANSESGIPLNILGLSPTDYSVFDWLRLIILAPIKLLTNKETFKYYVVEMGIDSPRYPKNMAYLLSIVRPHVAVVLNASLTHASEFDYLVKDASPVRRSEKLISLIAKEKMQLARGVGSSGVAIINLDQKEFARSSKDVAGRIITFGKSDKANLKILSTTITSRGFNFRFSYLSQKYELALPDIYPEHYAYTFAAAIATAASLGIPPTISLPSLASFRAPAGRLRIFPGFSDSTIIDSSYNASPSTMFESLKLLDHLAGSRKKIAVIGDMRELGVSAKLAHKNLVDWVMKYTDEVILFGDLTKQYCLPVLESRKFPVHHFAQMSQLTKYLRSIVRPKSYILVKGSQNELFLERAVESILADQKDVAKLCRRGPFWDKLRAKTP
ncbi:MAG: UDP-N-acetylmuramoyl-tripeptide--D-alanyl-D-alanine ligase [bacterium]